MSSPIIQAWVKNIWIFKEGYKDIFLIGIRHAKFDEIKLNLGYIDS